MHERGAPGSPDCTSRDSVEKKTKGRIRSIDNVDNRRIEDIKDSDYESLL